MLVSKRRKAALESSRRTFTWKPARAFREAEDGEGELPRAAYGREAQA